MIDTIAHRGPDDQGVWIDDEAKVVLGHRRLSIVDLSPLGHQPMASDDGRYMLSYNGEIYNHLELRAELEARQPRRWRGRSDTETLLEGISEWGLDKTLRKSVGMFALALWDKREHTLQLARDRFGEKPLYFGWVGGNFAFASEIGALRTLPGFNNEIDRRAVSLFASRTYVPAPLSIYKDIYKLQPGCIFSAGENITEHRPSRPPDEGIRSTGFEISKYWSYKDVVLKGLGQPFSNEGDARAGFSEALAAAIRGQAIADVPVGAFLSGGIDSSLVVALYQQYSSQNVRTFTIGFEEAGFDEAPYAKRVAEYFGTEHHERYVTVHEAQAAITRLPEMFSEPFADSSQVPTHIVSAFAREHVTVALSGDGGDEFFGGYNRYLGCATLWNAMKPLPRRLRSAIGASLGQVSPNVWNGLAASLPSGKRPAFFGAKVQKAFHTIGTAADLNDVFGTFLDEWSGLESPVHGVGQDVAACAFDLQLSENAPDATRMMYCDATSYLPDDILVKVDRASMANSLETRAPFLDHRLAEVAARIPIGMNIRAGKGKRILRDELYSRAPAALFERRKAGFAIPVGEWIKTSLRDWAESLLDPARLADDGFFDPKIVHDRWREHLRGERDSTQALWAILMFQAWREQSRVKV